MPLVSLGSWLEFFYVKFYIEIHNLDIFAVASVLLWGDRDPEFFGGLGTAIVRLFQVITLDRWSEMYTKYSEISVWIMAFLVIILETFVFEK
jgi:hypothetical protein